jgi:hypothetical protein
MKGVLTMTSQENLDPTDLALATGTPNAPRLRYPLRTASRMRGRHAPIIVLFIDLLRLLVLLPAFLTTTVIAQDERLLNYSIVGWASSEKSPSYGKAIVRMEVQRLLLDIASSPRTDAYVDSALTGSSVSRSDLEELRLLRREGNRYFLNFTLFTAADVKKVRSVSEHYARSLAGEFLSKRSALDSILLAYDAPGVDRRAVAFIVLGCVSLDWDGLKICADLGYRRTSSSRPDGDYIPYAEERTTMTNQRIYWGSNSDGYGNVTLTSFGDHFSPRRAFPEFLWSTEKLKSDSGLPALLRVSSAGTREDNVNAAVRQLGQIMSALRDSDRTAMELSRITLISPTEVDAWLGLLSGMQYVVETNGAYHALIPVLTKRDHDMVQQLRSVGQDIITSWLKAHYAAIRDQLAATAPTRNGVPYEEGFTMIWHFLFGMANNELVNAGLFADPYAEHRMYKGFIPAVFEAEAL